MSTSPLSSQIPILFYSKTVGMRFGGFIGSSAFVCCLCDQTEAAGPSVANFTHYGECLNSLPYQLEINCAKVQLVLNYSQVKYSLTFVIWISFHQPSALNKLE